MGDDAEDGLRINALWNLPRLFSTQASQERTRSGKPSHIIVICGLKMSTYDALNGENRGLKHSLERTRIPLAIVSPISGSISHANTYKPRRTVVLPNLLAWSCCLRYGLALPHNVRRRDDMMRFFCLFTSQARRSVGSHLAKWAGIDPSTNT